MDIGATVDKNYELYQNLKLFDKERDSLKTSNPETISYLVEKKMIFNFDNLYFLTTNGKKKLFKFEKKYEKKEQERYNKKGIISYINKLFFKNNQPVPIEHALEFPKYSNLKDIKKQTIKKNQYIE